MDILFNDLSFCNQFSSEEEFEQELKDKFIPCVMLLEYFSKKYNSDYKISRSIHTTERKLVNGKTLAMLLKKQTRNDFLKLKLILQKASKVYLDDINKDDFLQFAYSNNYTLYSFIKSDYIDKFIKLSEKEIRNIIDSNYLLEHSSLEYNFSLSASIPLEKDVKLKINRNEGNHKEPHFHLKTNKASESIKLRSIEAFPESNDSLLKDNKKWLEANKIYLLALWNYIHPENPVQITNK